MGYYLNNKEVDYVEYIKYLENTILSVGKFLNGMFGYGLPAIHPEIDEAENVIEENRKN